MVLVAIQDSAGGQMSDAAYNALKKFGARNQLKYKFRNSYALLGWSGQGVLDAVTQVIMLISDITAKLSIKSSPTRTQIVSGMPTGVYSTDIFHPSLSFCDF